MLASRFRFAFVLTLVIGLAAVAVAATTPADRGFDPERPKGSPDPDIAVVRGTAGPDDFGYTSIDSDEAGGPTYSWVEISGSGASAALSDDDETGAVGLGFTFPFYGTDYTQVSIGSNGYLVFAGGDGTDYSNDCPFSTFSPTPMVAPYWDDLDPGDDGALVYYEGFGSCPVIPAGSSATQCFVVQYEEFDFFPGDGAAGGSAGTFQAILYDSGEILYQYEGGPGLDGSSATIGVNLDGVGNSLTHNCGAAVVSAGFAVLVELGEVGDLEITKTAPFGVVLGGSYVYTIDVTNNGPDDQTGVMVSDVLPADLDYLGDSCGASAAGQNWTWNVGNLANGASVSCNVTVQLNTGQCVAVDNTADVTGDLIDPAGDSTSSHSNGGGEAVADPGFEDGTPNGFWNEASTNFGTPICDLFSCGTGTGTGPRSGDFWAWFGGIGAYEEGSVSQDVTISPGSDLTFWFEAIICDSPSDYIEVTIDGNQVWSVDGSWAGCGTLGYSQQTVDLAGYDDGGVHTLAFHSEIFAVNASGSNFFVDDVSLPSEPTCTQPPETTDLGLVKVGFNNGDGTGTYTFTVSNAGPDNASNATVMDTLPNGVAYVGDTCGGSAVGQDWTWNVGPLAVGVDAVCTMTVNIIDPADTLNNATVSGVGADPNPADNDASSGLPEQAEAIPTMGTFGIFVLGILLAATGLFLMRRF